MWWNYNKLRHFSLLQSAMDSYYKLQQLFCCKVRHKLLREKGYNYKMLWLTNCDSTTAIAFSLRWFTWVNYLESRKSRSCTGSSSSQNLKVCNIAQDRTTICKAVRFCALTTTIWMRFAWRSLSPSSLRWRSGIFVPRWSTTMNTMAGLPFEKNAVNSSLRLKENMNLKNSLLP